MPKRNIKSKKSKKNSKKKSQNENKNVTFVKIIIKFQNNQSAE